MVEQSLLDNIQIPQQENRARSWFWIAALVSSLTPWMAVIVRFLVAFVGMSFDVVELSISVIFYSIQPSFFVWLGLTVLSWLHGGWRHGLLALIGILPLGAILFHNLSLA